MVRLLLVRHGETIDNANKIMQGQTQGELNENGVKQAFKLSADLERADIDVFLSSDLKRAEDTCRIIAAPHDKPVVTTSLLRERDWGSFTGRYIPDLKNAEWPDDIETIEALRARAAEFIMYLKKTFQSKTVLAVGHGIINKAIQSVFYNKEMKDVMPMRNTELRVLIIE